MKIAKPALFYKALVLAGLVILLDQASKFFLFHNLLRDVEVVPITSFFSLVKRWNYGVSFSLLSNDHPMGPWVLSLLAIAICGFLIFWLSRAQYSLRAYALALIIGGAAGNIIDRLWIGAVQDFLLFYWKEWAWPAFNLADSAITIGVLFLIIENIGSRRSHDT